jgi:protein-disulfide isomerase
MMQFREDPMPQAAVRLFAASFALLALCLLGPAHSEAGPKEVTRQAIFNDPDAPVGGNPKGDVTIVAFEDYNCTNCKAAEPALQRLLKDDEHIRIVYKDWPIFGKASVHGAEIALAAKYQEKYVAVHDVLMKIPGTGVSEARMNRALRGAGVDIDRLTKDLKIHRKEIAALIQRNAAQATAMGFQGTPVFLIGPYNVEEPLNYAGFKKIVAEARAREK